MSEKLPEIETSENPLRRPMLPVIALMAVFGLLLHVAVFLFVSIPLGEGPPQPREEAFVTYAGDDFGEAQLYREQAILFDSRPLFVPTLWNVASSLQGIARLHDETELFSFFGPELSLDQGSVLSIAPDLVEEVEVLDERVPVPGVFPLRGFGQIRSPTVEAALQTRGGLLEIENLGSGSSLIQMKLPDSLQAPERMWTPAVFIIEVDPRAVGAPPLRVSGSGIASWDAALAEYIASPRFRRQLPSGYYRVTIGP